MESHSINRKLVYVCIPFTFNPSLSFAISNEISAMLMREGKIVFSPVSHSYPISDYLDKEIRNSHSWWMDQDLPILRKCDELLVVVIGDKGHELIKESKGCRDEIKEAMINQIPINYYQYDFIND